MGRRVVIVAACLALWTGAGHAINFKQVRVPGSGWPRYIDDIIVVDLNGDGYSDVVTIEGTWTGSPSKVRVFLGDGGLSFSRQYTSTQSGMGPPILTATDLTGDGKVDLAVKRSYFVIFPGKGNGSLLAPKLITPSPPTVPTPTHWTCLDIAGDARPDLVGRNSDGSLSAFQNLGQTKFEATRFGEGQQIASVSGGDFDGDGFGDVVGGSGSTLRFFKGNADGSFAAPVTSAVGENVGPHLLAADLNGDGRLDLLGDTSSSSGAGSSMLGKPKGKFGSKKKLPSAPSLHYGGVLTDLTSDGYLDLAAPSSIAGVDLFQGGGKGGFSLMGHIASWLKFTQNNGSKWNNRNVTAGDVNGDGVPDLVGLVWFPDDDFMTSTVLVFVTGGTPVSPTISNLSVSTLTYDSSRREVTVIANYAFQHPAGDIYNTGWAARDGAFTEFTVFLDFGASGTRSVRVRFGTGNYRGQTSGTISINARISNNTWPTVTPRLSIVNLSLWDYNLMQSNTLNYP